MAKLEAPWYSFRKMLNALFEFDPQVTVGEVREADGNGADYILEIEVANHDKCAALDRALPYEKHFGNVVLQIRLIDTENGGENQDVELYRTIFSGNPIVKDIRQLTDFAGVVHSYIRFQPEVVQFFDDDISDYNGNWTGLAKTIAETVFEKNHHNVNFCTADLRENGAATPMGVPG